MSNALMLAFVGFLVLGTAAVLLVPVAPAFIRAQCVVTGIRVTGPVRDGHSEVELDVMVRKPEGGQFPAQETTVMPTSALAMICPGSVIDAYYRPGDESAIAVGVPPGGPFSAPRRRRS